ncbi:MAG: pseudouridine synthase [Devosia sp.]|uniref:RluA family pseudouridine synthase n=1 Tax=Devosia sp. TaxID=1871048 RepID=UPI00262D9317|nr:RluA family pseudouridine synthase [Devosia sp.]MDB5542064.1 pseudouridine synthase [Devosia sp.]
MQDVSGEEQEWQLLVDAADAGSRLDAALARAVPVFSRNRIKDLILAGSVAINGRTVAEPKYKLREGDDVLLVAPEPVEAEPTPEDIPLDILYEDDQLIVVNKPVGMVVHPAPGNLTGTLVNALLFHCGDSLKGIGGVKRPGIVHRLDKDTSGVMVAAKTEQAHNHLAAQFADHGRTGPLHRAYLAFAWGRTQQAAGTVEAPLGRDQNNRLKQAVRKDGREAITHYAVEARFGDEGWDITRIRCELETGRTHQIRVHMAHIGHPLVADQIYASGFATKVNRLPDAAKIAVAALGRQALHAAELGFEHPVTGEEMRFEAPLPPDLEALEAAIEPYDRAYARP